MTRKSITTIKLVYVGYLIIGKTQNLGCNGNRWRRSIVWSRNEAKVAGNSACGKDRVCAFFCITVNRGYFERFLHSTLNIFFINCSTDTNPTPYLGLNIGPSSFTLKKKLAPLKFPIFKILCCVQSCPTMGLL